MRGTHIGVYGPFIVATTMSSAPKKRGCSARCGGPVAMATAGVKDGGGGSPVVCVGKTRGSRRASIALRVNTIEMNGVAASTRQKK